MSAGTAPAPDAQLAADSSKWTHQRDPLSESAALRSDTDSLDARFRRRTAQAPRWREIRRI